VQKEDSQTLCWASQLVAIADSEAAKSNLLIPPSSSLAVKAPRSLQAWLRFLLQSMFEGCNFLADFAFHTQLCLPITDALLKVIHKKFYAFSFAAHIEID